jgi:transposase-like protein
MPHGPLRNLRKEQFWRDLLTRWRDSGLSIRAFCRRHRLAEPSFYFWRRALSERHPPAPATANEAAVTFVPLTVRAEPVVADTTLEVILANGRRLRLPVGVAAEVVRAWVAVLEETPCSA